MDVFVDLASKFGLPIALLIYAVIWQSRGQREAYERLDLERKERLDDHKAQIVHQGDQIAELQRHVRECEEDRDKLWLRIGGQ